MLFRPRLELKKEGIRPLDTRLSNTVRDYMRLQKLDEKVKALKDKATIKIEDQNLSSVEQPEAGGR